jgi:hypothetical protein
MCSRDSGSRPLCPWNPDPNRLYALRLALVIFSYKFISNPSHTPKTTVIRAKKNTEKKLARRQITVKEESSNSWFICVNKILRKYDLKEAYNYLENPIKKSRWISLVKSRVNDHWCTLLTTLAQLYKGLQYLSNHNWSYFRSILLTHINQLLLDSSFTVICRLASFFSVFFFALMTDVIEECEGFYMNLCFYW